MDRRTVRRFAWLPTRLESGQWVHLRWYEAEQVLRASDDLEPWGSLQPQWETVARHSSADTAA